MVIAIGFYINRIDVMLIISIVLSCIYKMYSFGQKNKPLNSYFKKLTYFIPRQIGPYLALILKNILLILPS